MLGAGFETSAQLITWGMHSMLSHPDQWELLKSDRSLLSSAVEECVRHRTVTKRIFRSAKVDVEVGGVTIPEGSLIALSLASANHDESTFGNPEEFDIRRPPIPGNLTFGRGMHFCLGAPLSKTEMRITLETFLDHAPGAKIIEDRELEWKPDYRLEAVSRALGRPRPRRLTDTLSRFGRLFGRVPQVSGRCQLSPFRST